MAKVNKVSQKEIAGFETEKQSSGNDWAVAGHKRGQGSAVVGTGEHDVVKPKAKTIPHLNVGR